MRDLVPKLAPTNADGQVQRVAAHFSLIAAAGELAIKFDVLPWPRGAAIDAAEKCFKAWLNNRGTCGAAEIEYAISHLRAVIERDASRFQRVESKAPVANRIGFVRDGKDGDTEYLIMPEAWKTIMSGRDATRTARDRLDRRKLFDTSPTVVCQIAGFRRHTACTSRHCDPRSSCWPHAPDSHRRNGHPWVARASDTRLIHQRC